MTGETDLDAAHAAMQGAPADDGLRLGFYRRLADTELFVLLATEAQDQSLIPELIGLDGGQFVLGFDTEDRMELFAAARSEPALSSAATSYAAVSGRVLAQMLSQQEIGLALNLDVASSAILIPSKAIGWLTRTLDHEPAEIAARIIAIAAPDTVTPDLLAALRDKLAPAAGLVSAVWLAGVEYDGGARGHLLGVVDALESAQDAIAKAVSEAVAFTDAQDGALDVGFFASGDAVARQLAALGHLIELPSPPSPVQPARASVAPPGSNPDKPPMLK